MLNAVLVVLQWAAAHYFFLAVAILLVIGLRVSYSHIGYKIPSRADSIASFAGVLLLFAALLILFDAPATKLKDLLVIGIERGHTFDRDSLVGSRAYRVWHSDLCSRLSTVEQRTISNSLGLPCGEDNTVHWAYLRSYFVATFIGTGMLLVFGVRLLAQIHGKRMYTRATRRLVGIPVIAILVIQFTLLPHVYAKTIKSTNFNEAIIAIESSKDSISSEHGFILVDTAQAIAFFHKKRRQIWVVPKAKVHLMKIERQGDVLQFHYKASVAESHDAANEPP